MNKETRIYVTYIRTTPEKIWNALREPEITNLYWGGHTNVSDWKPGSKWEHHGNDEARSVKMVGDVVESVAPKRMVWTWAFPNEAADRAKHTRVTYDIEPVGEMVRLTVTHDELEPGSEMLSGISKGWPLVLSSLKSFLETGQPIDIPAVKRAAGW